MSSLDKSHTTVNPEQNLAGLPDSQAILCEHMFHILLHQTIHLKDSSLLETYEITIYKPGNKQNVCDAIVISRQ